MAQLNGTKHAETLEGTDGNDVIRAGNGDDIIIASTGADQINGGKGSDTMDYSAYEGELTIVLNGSVKTTVLGNGGPGDVLVNVENLIGGNRDDFFAGDDADNTFRGNDGSDYFVASQGYDRYYGGSGYDMVDYSSTGTGIVIGAPSHGKSTLSVGDVVYDRLQSIENFIGTAFDDKIAGGSAHNEIYGGDGNDQLKGGGGGDLLSGQAGDDELTGGKGADIFVFSNGLGRDTVNDFQATGDDHDVLDMRDVDTASSFDSMFYGHRIWQDGNDVMIDASKGDEIILKNVDIHDLSASDFLF